MMRSRKHCTRALITVLMGALIAIGVGLIGVPFNITRSLAQAEATTAVTQNATSPAALPSVSPFANVLTQLAAPTATNGPPVSATVARATVTATPEASATDAILSAADAMATISAQQAQIKSLQDQLGPGQSNRSATQYALVIIVIGLGLAFAIFFGLRRRSQ